MSRKNKSEHSLNSVYLDAFRKRKNDLLVSEINLTEDHTVSRGPRSANSVFLESFRRRKNIELSEALDREEEASPQPKENASVISEQSEPKQEASKKAVQESAADNKATPEEPTSKTKDETSSSENTAKNRNSRFKKASHPSEQSSNENLKDEETPATAASDTAEPAVKTASQEAESTPKAEADATEAAPKDETEATEDAPKAEADATEAAPKDEVDATETAPKDEAEATEEAPKAEADATEAAPKDETDATEEAPKAEASERISVSAASDSGTAQPSDKKNSRSSRGINHKKSAQIAILFSLAVIILCELVVTFNLINQSVLYSSQNVSAHAQNKTSSTLPQVTEPTDGTTTSASTTQTTTETVETTTTSSSIHYDTLSPGEQNDDVMKMQKRLAELGYISKKSCTGYYGDNTKKMIKMFQEKAGLKKTGIADSETLERLYADDAPDCLH